MMQAKYYLKKVSISITKHYSLTLSYLMWEFDEDQKIKKHQNINDPRDFYREYGYKHKYRFIWFFFSYFSFSMNLQASSPIFFNCFLS